MGLTPEFRRAPEPPMAWTAAQMVGSEAWRWTLTAQEIDEISAALANLVDTGKPWLEMTRADFPLPSLGETLRTVIAGLEHGPGVALIRGVPIESCDETQARLIAWGLSLHMGVLSPQDAQGKLVGDVRAVSETNGVRGNATADEIDYHVDPCDVVGLLCRRAACAGGESRIASAVAIYDHMLETRPDLVAALHAPVAFHRLGATPAEPNWYDCPVFGEAEGAFTTHYYRARILRADRDIAAPSLTPTQREAVDLVQALASDQRFSLAMDLEPGDLQLLCNHTVYHARTAYEDAEAEDAKRHMFRLWLSTPSSRPLPAAFGELFGDIRGGSVRGGVRAWSGDQAILAYQARVAAEQGMPFAAPIRKTPGAARTGAASGPHLEEKAS
jgi:hypothetical protein